MISRPDLPIVSFVSAALVLIPLPWHWRARNVATLSMIAWLFVMNFFRGLNSVFWADNIDIKYQVYCDISTKLIIGISYALPGAALCVCRHLASVASTSQARSSVRDKRWRTIFEVIMCFGIPCLVMALHYIVQGHRYDLLENIGCLPSIYISWPAILILWVPTIIMSIITMIYAGIALRFFIIRRVEFESFLRGGSSSLTTGRYLRLMGLAVTEILWGISLSSYILFLNVFDGGLRVWDNWEHVHSDFGRIDRFPFRLMPKAIQSRLLLSWWITPATAILFFLFFGFGEEAMAEYRGVIVWIRRNVLRQEVAEKSPSVPSLPTHMHLKLNALAKEKNPREKLDTLDTLDDMRLSAYDPSWDAPRHHATPSVSSFAKARDGRSDDGEDDDDAASFPRGSTDQQHSNDSLRLSHSTTTSTTPPIPIIRTDDIV